MILKNLMALMLAGLSLSALFAQERTISFEKFSLDNGLTVILHQDNSTPIVSVVVTYHVGSKNESPDRTGFAHFFEHLLFEGSENIERGEFFNYVQNAGGALNAYTTSDQTSYFEIMPSNQLELSMWLESERMLHAKVDEKGIETQREVVKEELRQRYENRPYGGFLREMLSRLYQKYPYRWPTIGSMEHLNAAEEKDYVDFYRQFYVPNNAVLVIAGDFQVEQAKAWVEKYFQDIPRREGPIYRPTIEEPPLGGTVRDTIYDQIQLPGVFKAYHAPSIGDEDFYAFQLLTQVMAEGESSRLYRALVDEQQLAVQTASFVDPREGPGLAIAFAIVNAGVDAKALEEAMDAEVKRLQEELISEEEFEKVRNQAENEFITGNATMNGIADNLAAYETLYGGAEYINEELKELMAVSREDIREAARNYLGPDKQVVLYYLPKPNQP